MVGYNYIVIEGIIGSGKTTLAKKLAEEYNGRLVLEKFEDNPFLPKFYADPKQYAFPLELSFLAERYQHINNELSIQDLFSNFTISDYHVMKSLIFANNTLGEDEQKLFQSIYKIIFQQVPKPDLWVYLHVSPERAIRNIQKRARAYEQGITQDYLEGINRGYLTFFKQQIGQRIVLIDVENLDFVENPSDYLKIKDILSRNYPAGLSFT